MPELDEEAYQKAVEDDRRHVQEMFEKCRQMLPEDRNGFYEPESMQADIDFQQLVEARRRHETKQAKKGTRKRARRAEEDDADPIIEETALDTTRKSVHVQLTKRFYEIMREDGEEQGATTGAARQIRWTSNVRNPGYTPTNNTGEKRPASGNSANAADVASAVAKKVRNIILPLPLLNVT